MVFDTQIKVHLILGPTQKSTNLIHVTLKTGWLKPKTFIKPGCQGNYEVKLSKIGMVLRWVTFLAFNVQCTLPPMIHPIIMGKFGWIAYFQPIMWEPWGLPFEGDRCQPTCPCPTCSPSKTISFCWCVWGGALIPIIPISRLYSFVWLVWIIIKSYILRWFI